jgi:hypothetical protein
MGEAIARLEVDHQSEDEPALLFSDIRFPQPPGPVK